MVCRGAEFSISSYSIGHRNNARKIAKKHGIAMESFVLYSLAVVQVIGRRKWLTLGSGLEAVG